MALRPKSTGNTGTPREFVNLPEPTPGNHEARVSLIVYLGEQNREDFVDENGESKAQKPVDQVAVFADLVEEVVDYGGDIGEQQYRLMLNKSFRGEVSGITLQATPPRDGEGRIVEGGIWTYHPNSPLTKLAKAMQPGAATAILDGTDLDIEPLLNQPFMCTVNVKKTPAKNDKKDKDGNPLVYTNVSFGGATQVPAKMMRAGVAELRQKPLLIDFDNVTIETARLLRRDVIRKIQQANNLAGTRMEAVLRELAKERGDKVPEAQEAPAPRPVATQQSAPPAQGPASDVDSFDDDIPF
ncbi:hypothetical protein X832_gp054 [Pseudomonas phage PAK_P5]|uniref:Uncharacterized protein n=1 Tax=Pseudomonas phage PAK_P5 TaxID=1327964 RepID=V5JXC1_9CAUD|nr:hypothetical protein X832_gp054 [Pseudomonas phage PAK_P5]AGR89524.1 hypothetical protein PAK_P500054 [Pseudomonas phage PAK_P5]